MLSDRSAGCGKFAQVRLKGVLIQANEVQAIGVRVAVYQHAIVSLPLCADLAFHTSRKQNTIQIMISRYINIYRTTALRHLIHIFNQKMGQPDMQNSG